MIRPMTLLSALLFVLSGAYLFAVKHRSQMLDDQIAQYSQASLLDAQKIQVLQAQWALEADPSRLAELSAQFTTLQPMKPGQLVTLAALESALPPPGAAVPGRNPVDELPAMLSPPPVQVASVAPPPKPAGLQNVEALLRALPERRVHVRHAAPVDMGASALAPESIPQPLISAQVVSVRAVSTQAPAPMDSGSMLGMAQDTGSNN